MIIRHFKEYIDMINEGLIETYKLGKEFFVKDITPIIYEIDNSDGIINKPYIDINYNGGYYTLNNIPPDVIEISVGV